MLKVLTDANVLSLIVCKVNNFMANNLLLIKWTKIIYQKKTNATGKTQSALQLKVLMDYK